MDFSKLPVVEIDISRCLINPMVNRGFEESDVFYLLVEDIREKDQLTPILVRETEDSNFQIIDGAFRWHAMKKLNYSTIKAQIVPKEYWLNQR